MAAESLSRVLQQLRHVLDKQTSAGDSDAELLNRYLRNRDQAAFAAIVRRHGPMVFGVCRRVLRHEADAEDAFQAAFMVLIRKAASLRSRALLGNWLYGVAYRTALQARRAATRRRTKEAAMTIPTQTSPATTDDLREVLDQELDRLPGKYRAVLVLCDLEGKTRKEAARQLGWPEGTVACRLARARALLARRLTRYGFALSSGALALAVAEKAPACAPEALVARAVKAALLFAMKPAADVASSHAAAMAKGVLHTMFLKKLKIVAVFVLIPVAIGGVGVGAYHVHAQASIPKSQPSDNKPAEAAPDKPAARAPENEADTLTTLMRERLKLAQEEVEICAKLYQAVRVDFDVLATAWKDLLKAELELSTTRADRIAAHERRIKMMERWVEFARVKRDAGRDPKSELLKARYLLVDAKIDLEREKTRK